MDTLQTIYERRAIKKFDATHVMPADIKHKILDAAKQSPSSFNIQHWRLLDIVDKNLRQQVCEASWNQAQVTDASMVVIVCVDVKAHEKEPNRYWKNAPDAVRDYLVSAIGNFYNDKPQLQRDEAMRSAGLIAQTLMLASKALGYDSCPMIGLEFDKVAKLINLPTDYEIAMMITIGKQTQPAQAKGGFLPDNEFVRENTF
jgi:nitroreductase